MSDEYHVYNSRNNRASTGRYKGTMQNYHIILVAFSVICIFLNFLAQAFVFLPTFAS